jgi:hypothetical protein
VYYVEASMAKKKITFIIDGFTPDTLPIGRLAEYLKNFAVLVGTDADVHFERVGKGSAALVSRAPEEVVPEVRGRIAQASKDEGPAEAVRGFTGLKTLLYQDKTTGRIKEERRKIIEFPKATAPQYGPIWEESTLEGIIIRIGGKDETIHVHIQNEQNTYPCVTNRSKARELKEFLLEFDKPVRVFGKGKWIRSASGAWDLDEFRITGHEPLNGQDLDQVFARMREIPGSDWDKMNDPLSELDRIRRGSSKIH